MPVTYTDVGVADEPVNCTDGEVMLTNQQAPNIGIPRLCINHHWKFLCGDLWDSNDVNTLCGELGFQPRGWFSTRIMSTKLVDTSLLLFDFRFEYNLVIWISITL